MQFLSYTGNVATQVGVMLLLILVGLVAAKRQWFRPEAEASLVNILFYIVTPTLIVHSFLSVEYTPTKAAGLLYMAGCAVLVHLVGVALAFLVFRKDDGYRTVILRAGVIFSNGGYMSLPLASALMGDTGVFYVSVYVVVFNVLLWTLGIAMYDKSKINLLRAFLNPGTVGIYVGLPLFFFGVRLPSLLTSALTHLSNINTPLAMLLLGYFLSRTALGIRRGDGKLLACTLLRILAVPGICLLAFWVLPIPAEVVMACMVPASAPVATNVVMFASKFGRDVDSASRLVSVSTLCSVLTIPVFLSLANLICN